MAIFPGSAIPSAAAADYTIDQSLRFDNGDSAYLSRTPLGEGNRKTFTISVWAKLTTEQSGPEIFGAYTDSNNYASFGINSNKLWFGNIASGSWTTLVQTGAVQRDPSSWYHLMVKVDTTKTTAADRVVLYINGVDQTSILSSTTYPAQASEGKINSTTTHKVGSNSGGDGHYWDGYLAEFHFIDNQALTPSYFGEEDSDTGQWKPIEVTDMDYGAKGFYQKYNQTALAASFTDSSTGGANITSFTTVETTSWTAPTGVTSVDYLVVAGGGGGGASGGSTDTSGAGGGGAGGVKTGTLSVTPGSSYTVTVGDGGAGKTKGTNAKGGDGEDSVFSSITSTGGGGGGSAAATAGNRTGADGGSGGGGSAYGATVYAGGSGTGSEGNDGGDGGGTNTSGGGGGGASEAGDTGAACSDGGDGVASSISGASVTYGGGGGGGKNTNSGCARGDGGAGGGGMGGDSGTDNATAGTATTGGGGGGGGGNWYTSNGHGKDGGSGIVIISYEDPALARHTITANGDAANQRPQPHKNIGIYGTANMLGPKVGTSLIDGFGTSSDYITVADSSDWDFGTGDFTFECWYRRSAYDSRDGYLWDFSDGTSRITGLLINDAAGYRVNWFGTGWSNTTEDIDGGLLNKWHHLALVRDSGTGRWYVDGVQQNTLSSWTTDFSGTWTNKLGIRYAISSGDWDEWQGVMEQFRISNSCRYPSGTTFTPPTENFTADSNTKLLLQNGTDGSTTFTDGSSSSNTVTASGDVRWFAPKIGAGAIALDGSGDYIQFADSEEFYLGSGEFTLECYFKAVNLNSTNVLIDKNGSSYSYRLQIDSNTGLRFIGSSDGSSFALDYAVTQAISTDTWHHVAVTRDSSDDVKIWFNGSQVGVTLSSSLDFYDVTEPLKIGMSLSSSYFDGYIDEVRVSRRCRYTTTFTPTTTEFTDDINTALLVHGDQNDGTGFQDSSTGLAISEKSRMSFDGTGDYLSVPASSDFNVGTNFTAECWFQYRGDDEGGIMGTQDSSGYSGWFFRITNTTDTLDFNNYGSSGGAEAQVTSGTLGWGLGQWYHLAIVKDGNDYEIFRDGVSVATATDASSLSSGGALFIGKDYASDETVCKMDEIRISDSARYTSNFTPQTRGNQFTADANTMLLIHSDWEGGLGADSSGNYNNFTATNLVATDVVKDSPSNNFATLNPLIYSISASGATFSEGNLKASISDANYASVAAGTIYGSGKFYCEFYIGANTNTSGTGGYPVIGVISSDYSATTMDAAGHTSVDSYWYMKNGQKIGNAGSAASYGDTWTTGDIIGVALDLDNGGNLYFSKNGTWQDSGDPTSGGTATGAAFTGLSGTFTGLAQMFGAGSAQVVLGNFGSDSSFAGTVTAQGNGPDGTDFYYDPPTDYLALCTDNLPSPEIADPTAHFDTVLYTGTSASHTISSLGFQPDFTWHKSRSYGSSNALFNSIRGGNFTISTNGVAAEVGPYTDMITAFSSSGFTMGADATQAWINQSGNTYVSWNWLGGGTAVSNTDGSITSSVSANPTAGFSVVQYTGNDTAGATYGHGLSQTPELLITWSYENAQHKYVWLDFMSDYQYVGTDRDVAMQTEGSQIWDVSGFNSSVIEIMDNYDVNDSGAGYTSYVFHSVEGYSKMGTYVSNNSSNGVFLYCGFSPAFFIVKCYDATADWIIFDNKRNTYNVVNNRLEPNSNNVEDQDSNDVVDFVSNGIKIRGNGGGLNYGTRNQVWMAFASTPFKTANAR